MKESQPAEVDLAPWGRVISGQPGISANRLAQCLGVSVGLVKKLAQPIGQMKMPYRNAFAVYDAGLAQSLVDHPDVIVARGRKQARAGSGTASAKQAAQTRRQRVAEQLVGERSDLSSLYSELLQRLWSPSSERDLLDLNLYRELPAMLWDALAPRQGQAPDATELIVDILWAMTKRRTFKVNEFGGQDMPLAYALWSDEADVESDPEPYRNVFAAAIRHVWYNDGPGSKGERRQMALERLRRISSRTWAEDE